MDHEAASRKRDAKLRDRMLMLLDYARAQSPTGRLSGETLYEQVNDGLPDDRQIQSSHHAMALIRYLVDAGYVDERLLTRRRTQIFGLEHVEFRITQKGTQLHNEELEPDPLVWDERIMGDK